MKTYQNISFKIKKSCIECNLIFIIAISILFQSCNSSLSINEKLQDTIAYEKFLDNYIADTLISDVFQKPYEKALIWTTVKVEDSNGKFIRETKDVGFIIGFTQTMEKIPKPVLIINASELSRAYFLDSLISEEKIPWIPDLGKELAEGLHSESKMTLWRVYRFDKPTIGDQIIKVRGNILVHSKNDEIFMIQMAEPSKNLFTYLP